MRGALLRWWAFLDVILLCLCAVRCRVRCVVSPFGPLTSVVPRSSACVQGFRPLRNVVGGSHHGLNVKRHRGSFLRSDFRGSLCRFHLASVRIFPSLLRPPGIAGGVDFRYPIARRRHLSYVRSYVGGYRRLFIHQRIFHYCVLRRLMRLIRLKLSCYRVGLIFAFGMYMGHPPSLFKYLYGVIRYHVVRPRTNGRLSNRVRRRLAYLEGYRQRLCYAF